MLARSIALAQVSDTAAPASTLALQNPDPSIFLLEDNDLNAMVLKEILKTFGLRTIQHARTLEQTETWMPEILSGQFDLIIADIMLPDGLSLPLIERLVTTASAPVALYTAKLMREDQAEYERIGVAHVFEKPVTLDRIRAGLAILLGE